MLAVTCASALYVVYDQLYVLLLLSPIYSKVDYCYSLLSVWLAQLVRALAAPTHARFVCRRSGFDLRSGQAGLWLPFLRVGELVYRWVTTTYDCGVKVCSREMAQTNTSGSLTVSEGALEIAIVIQGAFEVF